MADSATTLSTIKGGIQRHRVKGAASSDSLYDLLNGYVTKEKTVKVRPGTFRTHELPNTTVSEPGPTRGLVAFESSLHVFSAEDVEVPDGVTLHIISHPDRFDSNGDVINLERIHFAKPFLGFLYVVATFDTGDTYHFWLRSGATWEADKTYMQGDIVHPTTPNGFAYVATRLIAAYPQWTKDVPRAINDKVEPVVYNGYYFNVTAVLGGDPHSGAVEPDWNASDGALTMEDADSIPVEGTPAATQPDISQQPDPATQLRYRFGELRDRRLNK